MSKYQINYVDYLCDLCGKRSAHPDFEAWFAVNGGKGHLCCKCGHDLHTAFEKFGIKHEFICTQYADKPALGAIVSLEGSA